MDIGQCESRVLSWIFAILIYTANKKTCKNSKLTNIGW